MARVAGAPQIMMEKYCEAWVWTASLGGDGGEQQPSYGRLQCHDGDAEQQCQCH